MFLLWLIITILGRVCCAGPSPFLIIACGIIHWSTLIDKWGVTTGLANFLLHPATDIYETISIWISWCIIIWWIELQNCTCKTAHIGMCTSRFCVFSSIEQALYLSTNDVAYGLLMQLEHWISYAAILLKNIQCQYIF